MDINREWTRMNANKDLKTNSRWTQIYADKIGFDCIHSKGSAIDFLDGTHFFRRGSFRSNRRATPKISQIFLI